MRPFVRSDFGQAVILGTIVGLFVIVADVGAGATYLIAIGFLALWIGIQLGPERVRLWREKHADAPAKKP